MNGRWRGFLDPVGDELRLARRRLHASEERESKLLAGLDEARAQRDDWIRKYTRLEGGVNAHQKADAFKDTHDDALYKLRDKLAAWDFPPSPHDGSGGLPPAGA